MTEKYDARLRRVAADQLEQLDLVLLEYAEQAERSARRLNNFAAEARKAKAEGTQMAFPTYEARRGLDVLESAMSDIQRFQDRLAWTQGLIDAGKAK